jgi:hypothetical protein
MFDYRFLKISFLGRMHHKKVYRAAARSWKKDALLPELTTPEPDGLLLYNQKRQFL